VHACKVATPDASDPRRQKPLRVSRIRTVSHPTLSLALQFSSTTPSPPTFFLPTVSHNHNQRQEHLNNAIYCFGKAHQKLKKLRYTFHPSPCLDFLVADCGHFKSHPFLYQARNVKHAKPFTMMRMRILSSPMDAIAFRRTWTSFRLLLPPDPR
jgi:hypothetical protein